MTAPDADLAALLAEHTAEWVDWDSQEDSEYYTCLCREVRWHVNTSADYYAAHAAHLAAVVRAAGWMKGREEWGIRYEKTADPTMDNASGEVTSTMWLDSEAKVRAAVKNGAPISARNRRAVRRYVTEPEEA